jgi:long-chain acyl-CoA synthetase
LNPDALLKEFDHRLSVQPGHILLVGRTRTCTTADLEATSRAVADLLARREIPAGSCICIRACNGQGFLALLLGTLRHRAVPILLDAQTPDAAAQRAMATMGAVGMLHCATAWPQSEDDLAFVAFSPAKELHLTDPAVIKLTSGSTGEARGIEAPLPALLADEENLAITMGIQESDRLLVAVPLAHSYGLSSLALPALVRGTTLIIPEAGNPFSTLQAAADLRVTVFPTTPAYLEGLARWEGGLPQLDSLRLLISAGALLRPETARKIRESWGHPVHAFYGASECGGIAYDAEGGAAEESLVGNPVHRVSISLAETNGRPSPGKLLTIQSPAVARRYLPGEDPRLGGGRFITDDLGTLENGQLRLHGRLGPVVKIRGKKVHPAEVEQILFSMPGVQQAYVHAARVNGESGESLEAFVVPAGNDVVRSDVMTWCRLHLAPEKIPRRIQIVKELPRTERGKIEFSRLSNPRA